MFQYLAKFRFHAFGGEASGLIQQLKKRPGLQCQDAQFGKYLLVRALGVSASTAIHSSVGGMSHSY
jgi:hypothetical protein